MKKKTKRTVLKPLTVGEVIPLPCGATVEVKYAKKRSYYEPANRISTIQVKITSETGLGDHEGHMIPSVRLGFYGMNIDKFIEILRRAKKVK